ncbi:uncharacterized protein LOC110693327 [Chenopodium quinoa]|uniref:uncharacterized protein LOC110693327 n=1 Tax=Chenopodium quinoa TaxID=63459 RepID=UPI000B77094D|nr:uncharacterized protein LOC110693327 [Chenopodium quinoa]
MPKKISKSSIFALLKCISTCQDHTNGDSRQGTRVRNLSDRTIELQIRVGSILRKVHTLKPGSSKRLKSKSIYKAYMPQGNDQNNGDDNGKGNIVVKRYAYYYDETCMPYVWIHDAGGSFSRMVKQQYISLEDLRDCSEIKIFRDHQKGCIAVRKKFRADFC